jgi:hypothetical protein
MMRVWQRFDCKGVALGIQEQAHAIGRIAVTPGFSSGRQGDIVRPRYLSSVGGSADKKSFNE